MPRFATWKNCRAFKYRATPWPISGWGGGRGLFSFYLIDGLTGLRNVFHTYLDKISAEWFAKLAMDG